MPIRQWTPFRQVYNAIEAVHASRRMLEQLLAQRDEGVRADLPASAPQPPAFTPPAPSAPPRETATVDVHDALGFRLLLDRASTIDRELLETGTWEGRQLDYFRGLVERLRGREGAVFLDVGAYWGLYSLIAHRSGVFSCVRAIEADRHNFAQLQANLFLNDAARSVECFNKAASVNDAPLLFRHSASHPDGNRGGSSVLPPDTSLPAVRVPATSIDAVLADLGDAPRAVLMKIDVEGFEAYVLRGMAQTVRRHRVTLQIEIFDLHAEPALAELEKLGLVRIHALAPDYYHTNDPEFLPVA